MGSAASKQVPQAARKLGNTTSSKAAAAAATASKVGGASGAAATAAGQESATPLASKTKFEKFVAHETKGMDAKN